jgi:hypothetical protein
MKNYKQFLKELPSKKVVFAFGRFQPPTIGHELLVKAVQKLAKGADHVIYASHTQDSKKNPLPVDRKVYYLKRMFPGVNFQAAGGNTRTFIEVAKELNKKYKNIVMVAGSDRVPEYKRLLETYNGKEFNFDSIEVVSAGERDPDSDNASGMSGTKMREAAKKGDFNSFKRGLPSSLTSVDSRRLMNEIREGMGLSALKEEVKFQVGNLRENYFQGKIFNIDDIVEENDQVYRIVKRGSNHLLVENEQGDLISKWITDVVISEKEFKKVAKDKETGQPKKYVAGVSGKEKEARDKHFEKNSEKHWDDPTAYKPAPGDDKETKPSQYTKKFKQMYGEETELEEQKVDKHELAGYVVIDGYVFKDSGKQGRSTYGRYTIKDPNYVKDPKEVGMGWRFKKPDFLSFSTMAELKKWLKTQPKKSASDIDAIHKKFAEREKMYHEEFKLSEEALTEMKFTSSDKIKVARIIANALGVSDVEGKSSPTELVNSGLRKLRTKRITPEMQKILDKMLVTARDAGIDFNEKLVPGYKPSNIKEACWDGYKQVGMKKKGNRMVPDCVPEAAVMPGYDEEEAIVITDDANKGLAAKAEKSGISVSILRQVYNRGVAAWRTGHRPGTTPQQWGMARVNSFIVGGKTRHTADADLWKKVRKESVEESKDYTLAQDILQKKDYKKLSDMNKPGDSMTAPDQPDHVRKQKVRKLTEEEESELEKELDQIEGLEDDQLDSIAGELETMDDEELLDLYDDEELEVVDDEGNPIKDEEEITEAISRQERIRRKIRFAKFKTKRQRRAQIALHRYSNQPTINRRARRAAIKALKQRIAKRPLARLSIPEKERLETLVKKRKDLVDRLARRMAPTIRKIEKKRLSHSNFTKEETDPVRKAELILRHAREKETLKTKQKRERKELSREEATPYYKKDSFIKKMSAMAKRERLERERKEKEKQTQTKEEVDLWDEGSVLGEWTMEEWNTISEAEYQGKKVQLNDPFRASDGKHKFYVYVQNDKGNVIKLGFGDPNMEIKRDDPDRRKNFRARHQCDTNPGPKWKARYWSCKMWQGGKSVSDMTKG